jgi:accessory gene regulator B
MTRIFSKTLVKWLLKMGAISQQDTEVYEYGIYSFLFSLLPFALVLMLSIPLGMVMEGLLLIIPFFFLRKFTGGFHFQYALPCIVTSTLLLFASLIGIKILLPKPPLLAIHLAVYLSLFPIFLLSPIDSVNRKLSQKEQRIFHRIAIGLSCFFTVLFTLLMGFELYRIAVPVGGGVVLTALLQLPCLPQKIRTTQSKT